MTSPATNAPRSTGKISGDDRDDGPIVPPEQQRPGPVDPEHDPGPLTPVVDDRYMLANHGGPPGPVRQPTPGAVMLELTGYVCKADEDPRCQSGPDGVDAAHRGQVNQTGR